MMLAEPRPVLAERSSSDVPRIAVTRRRADRTKHTYMAARDEGTRGCGNDGTNSREMTKTRWHAAHRRPLPYLEEASDLQIGRGQDLNLRPLGYEQAGWCKLTRAAEGAMSLALGAHTYPDKSVARMRRGCV